MGADCGYPCTHGKQVPMDSGVCKCDACYVGLGCTEECSGHGKCQNGSCLCDELSGWRGSLCEVPGCPGIEEDCSGHGSCNSADKKCICDPGWTGIGCHVPDCPGTPNCFGRGFCNSTDRETPECTDCSLGWMGPACNDPCLHGRPVDDICDCDPCYTGNGCQLECSGRGSCVKGECVCHSNNEVGWQGINCELDGCPGVDGNCNGNGLCNTNTRQCECDPLWTGPDCGIANCAGDPPCSGHGSCDAASFPRRCNCDRDWAGEACDVPCVHGINYGNASGCICDACYHGIGCQMLCSGHGRCEHGQCVCNASLGYKGVFCDIPGCPGWPEDCSGHGTCNLATKQCSCDPGWLGPSCSWTDCPGTPDCNDNGICVAPRENSVNAQGTCNCSEVWMGEACQHRCIYGNPTDDYICECEPCYNGLDCSTLCSNKSSLCVQGECDCGFEGWRGEFCERRGCPGVDKDCSGHGTCFADSQTCACDSGWTGVGCQNSDCPGDPDCNGKGRCVIDNTAGPVCVDCEEGWIGRACEIRCQHGSASEENPDVCICDSCYTGFNCDQLCSGRVNATCLDKTCVCGFEGWRGDLCDVPGCPGLNSMDCSGHGTCFSVQRVCECNSGWLGSGCHIPVCPGSPQCSAHGKCVVTSDIPTCTCDDGWMDDACQTRCLNGTVVKTVDNQEYCECKDCFSGISCDLECSGRGVCVNNTCDCGFDGWRGATCDVLRCPGWGSDCSDHGVCIPSLRQCTCNPGWKGMGCQIPHCAGGGNCSNHGTCDGEKYDPPVCTSCDYTYFGKGCERRCFNGSVVTITGDSSATNDEECRCDECYSGVDCGQECSGHGQCENGTCKCDVGWRGDTCGRIGCPGIGQDCSGHGRCLSLNQECHCDKGWKEIGCENPDCPGVPDCNGKGTCDGSIEPPRCVNCTHNTMGRACELPCIHGNEDPPNSAICKCDSCHSGQACDLECSAHGTCANNTCVCQEGWRGDLCELPDCPGDPDCSQRGVCIRASENVLPECLCNQGFGDPDCSKLLCPGNPPCNNRGNCVLSKGDRIPHCACRHNFVGQACEQCAQRYTGANCEDCVYGFIGWPIGCNVSCFHGNASGVRQDNCVCHNDSSLGYWRGKDCAICQEGWDQPECTSCDLTHVGESCDILCYTEHAHYGDPRDAGSEKLPVIPTLSCITNQSHDYILAWFGYHNKNPHNVYLDPGPLNFFSAPTPSIEPGGELGFLEISSSITGNTYPVIEQDLGQPRKFLPGEYKKFFAVKLKKTVPVVWVLEYPASNTRHFVKYDPSNVQHPTCSGIENSTQIEIKQCLCRNGFWDRSCDKECPGGASSPCNGHGVCNKTTGTCVCEPRWRGNLNCSACTTGWTSNDCSVIITRTSNLSAVCTGYGDIITLDGVGYSVEGTGEYILFSSNDLEIQINIVPCYQYERCINAVAMALMTSVITIHAPYQNGGDSTLWIDKVQSFSLKTLFNSDQNTFKLERSSWASFKFYSEDLLLDIRIFGRYIDLAIILTDPTWCSRSKGLWGSCDVNIINDFIPRNSFNISQNFSTIHEISQSFINKFVRSWKVLGSSVSLFIFNTRGVNEPRFKTDALYCLRFQDTGITSRNLFTLAGGDITIEMMVKSDGIDGTLFSYATTSTLAIVVKTTVRIFYGYQEFDTFLNLQQNRWNLISLIWLKKNRIIQFVLIEDSEKTQVRNFPVNSDQDIFAPGGTLTLGYWYSSGGAAGSSLPGGFSGEVDEVRIWNKRRLVTEIVSSRVTVLDCTSKDLASLWRFNEGQGNLATDCVAGVRFQFPVRAQGPIWVYSSANLELQSDNKGILTVNEKLSLERVCEEEIFGGSYGKQCNVLDSNVKIFYTMACYELVLSSGEITERVWSVFTYLDYCKASLGVDQWPGNKYCDQLTKLQLPNWVSLQCQMDCKFGSALKNGDCQCEPGFYGRVCSQECPGGYATPCGGFSECNKLSGTCTCPLNANLSIDCRSCSPGWTGEKCSIAITNNARSLETTPVCQSYGGGHFTTFDGSNYDVKTSGEFYLVRSTNFIAQIRHEPCMNSSSCVSAIALRLGKVNLTLRASYEEQGKPLLYIDQYKTDYTVMQYIEGGYEFRQEQLGLFRIRRGRERVLEVRAQDKYLSISLFSDVKTCWNVSGLCSSCDNNTANDYETTTLRRRKRSTDNPRQSISTFVENWSVLPPDSMFVYKEKEKREMSSSEYCLQYNGTAVDTRAIYGSFTTSENVTFEFFVKIEKHGGTILSYASVNTFGIINDVTIKIQFSSNVMDTGIRLTAGQWYWLTITFSRRTRIMRVYCLDASGLIRQRTMLVPYALYTSGGVLSVGHWQTTGSGATDVNRKPFFGYIDEIRIWDITIEAAAVKQSRDRLIKYQATGLVSLWLFYEGEGTIAHDIIGGNDLRLAVEPTSRPRWVFSYARTSPPVVSSDNILWSNVTLKSQVESLCKKFLIDTLYNGDCGNELGLAHAQYYYTRCLDDVKASGVVTSAFQSIVSYADYCRNILELETWPLDRYCNEIPKEYVGVVKGPYCNVTCLFGEVTFDGCVCYTGYWGENCSAVCPEGAITPCNGRGVCNSNTGKCTCDYNWQGNENCTMCTPGWEGRDCSVASATQGNASSVGLTGGHYQTFDGIRFTFLTTGEFKVVQSSEIVVHLRQVPCRNGRFRCIDGLAFLLESKVELIILASVPGTEHPVFWLNKKRLELNEIVTSIGDKFTLVQTTSVTLELRSLLYKVIIRIRFTESGLQYIIVAPKEVCGKSVALGGSCDGLRNNDHNGTSGTPLEKLFRVLPPQSLFSAAIGYKDFSSVLTGAENALKFTGVGITTDIIGEVFTERFVTVELLYLSFDGSGTLFTYSKEMIFSVVLFNGEFCLRMNDMVNHTGIKTSLNMWNQISVVYNRASGRVYFYHINSQGHATVKSIFTHSNMFAAGSKIAIGQWIPGGSVVVTTSPGFRGKIDEVRIWNRQFSGADIRSSWRVNVQYSAKYLAVLWKFNEGQGIVVKDIKSHVHLYIQEVQHSVEWVYGTALVTILPIVTPVATKEMVEWCTGHILNSPVAQICRGLGAPSRTVYYRACLGVTSVSGDVLAGVTIVVAYSDYCQFSLGLITWPARTLCNYPSFLASPHIPWTGSVCQQACYFGTRTAYRCTCLPGFYGSSCSSVCPGGVTSRCYGNGACSQTTGRCTCNYNWYGSSCNRCRPGYYGTDCSLNIGGFIAIGSKTSISLSGNGNFIGLSGAAWVYRGTGEFNAIVSRRLGISVQLRQVMYGTGVRVRCAVVRTGAGVLAIHSGVQTGVTITLNGKPIDYNKYISIGSGFVYRKRSHNKLEITGPEGFTMLLYYRQVYFGVQIAMDKSFCRDTCGLFGNCGNSRNLNCTSAGLLERFNKSTIRQQDIDEFMSTWSIPRNESQFRDVLAVAKETNIITAAGTCLFFFKNSLITPSFVDMFHGKYLTIQFHLKVKELHTYGTIFSFVLNTNFAFRINGTLKIHFGVKIYDTNIFPELDNWNHITFVYHRVVGILEVYVRNSVKILVTRAINIGMGAFEPGGKLALGLWQATTGVITSPGGFVGWIDELVIWNKRFDLALIENYVGVSIVQGIEGVVGLWKFNEGTGWIARDLVGSLHFNLPKPPWSSPLWVPSDLYIAVQSEVKSRPVTSDNKTTSLCGKIFSSKSLNDSCGQMDERKDFSYEACLQDVQSSGFIDAGKDSVMSYARECQVARNLTNLPGNDLCDVFTDERYDDWSGTACDVICIYGTIENNTCHCDEGYWGVTCSQECPGGASNPCNKRGKCDVITGVCTCDWKWRGDSGCNRCTLGWMGSECAIAVPKSLQPTTSVTAAAGSGGILIAGDGTIFRLNSVGEFTLLKGENVDVQVRQVPCRNGKALCFNAVGVLVNSTSISIHAPYGNGEDPVININGTVIDKNDISKADLAGVNISFPGPYEVQVNYGDKLGIRVNINGQHMTLETTTSTALSKKLGGLLGSTSRNTTTSSSNTSVPSLKDLLNATDIDEAVRKVFGVSPSSSRVIILDKERHETVVVYGGGYSLFFKFTAIFSKPVVQLFIEDVITFEIMVKMNCAPAICGGPILSYTSSEMFYISTYSTLRVIIGTQVYDTGLRVEVKHWNQVTMTFWSLNLEMAVCLTLSQGTLLCKSFKVVTNPFLAGGTIAIGAWQPSPNGRRGVVPTTTVVGEIDEFRTWNRAFDYALLQQRWLVNLAPDIDGLTGLWKFNEGVGSVVNDLVGNNHLYFPGEPWNKPVWYYSDLPIPYMGISRSNVDNNIISQLANTTCFGLFHSGPLLNYCSRLSSITRGQYYDMCVESVTATGRNTSSLESVLLYSDYCMKTLSIHLWPAQSLCNKFPGEVFPKWIGKNCDIPCVFGMKDKDNPEKCKCNFGYWGVAACDQTCPGGTKSPCTNHGTCDPIFGKCTCELEWTGTDDCSTCAAEWTGSDCSFAISKVTVISGGIRFSGMFGLSLFTTLDGHSFTPSVIGEYYLFYSVHVHFSVQIRLVHCYGISSCVNSIAFRTASHTLVLHGPYTTDRYPVIWLDGSLIDLDLHHVTTSVYGFFLRKESTSVYIFEYSTFKISIRVRGRYLNLVSKVSGVICDNSYGILGSCNNPFLASLDPGFPLSNCTDKNTSVRESLTSNVYDMKNVTTEAIGKLVQNLKVHACDSLFVYRYGSYHEYRDSNAGYALHFHQTAIVSGLIWQPFEHNDITIEFYIKLSSIGVIFSYTKFKTFVLTATSTHCTIYFGDRKFDTNIAVQLNHWNQIAFVFRKLTSVLQLYHFDYQGQLTRQDLVIGEDIFPPGGVLAIGAWQPSLDGSGPQLRGYFTGYVDEFKIWTMGYHPAVVSQAWLREVGVNTKNLARLWKLDEGEGLIAREDLTGSVLNLETSPWRSPTWAYSQIELKPALPGTASTTLPFNQTFEEIAKSFCTEIILEGPLKSSCNLMGPAVSTYYFKACVSVVMTTEDVAASLDIVIAYSDYCQSILELSTWPARLLCNKFPGKEFPIWYGSQCDKKCYNRDYKASAVACICRRGSWGYECQNICRGGTLHPCNDHGICTPTTGECRCYDNWSGSRDCGVCARNWKGVDCSLAVVRHISSVHVHIFAVVDITAHYVTFDGMAFHLAVVGDYYLFKTRLYIADYVTVQVRHAPCVSQSVCIVAVAIKLSSTHLVIHAPKTNQDQPLMWINNKQETITQTRFGTGNAELVITMDAPSIYTIKHKDVFSLGVLVVGTALSLNVDLNSSNCSAHGILGNCDGDPENDLPLGNASVALGNQSIAIGNVSQGVLNNDLVKVFEVDIKDSLFVVVDNLYLRRTLYTGARYALHFNQNGVISQALFKTFKTGTDVTIELLFKPFSNGTVLSYAYYKTFGIMIRNTLQLEFGHTWSKDTGIYIEVDTWYHLSITWNQNLQFLEIYLITRNGVIHRRQFNIPENPFRPGGILTLGYWEPSPGDTEIRIRNGFTGVIDELRVWHRAFNPVTVQQNWRMNVLPNAPSLSGLWKFNEGSGDTVHNLVTTEHLYLPSKVWSPAIWILSDADIALNLSNVDKPFENHFVNQTLHDSALEWCKALFYRGTLDNYCKNLGAIAEFYYLTCVQTIARTTQLTSTLSVVVQFSDYCQKSLSLSNWPARELCNHFGDTKFPYWIGERCDVPCLFGHRDPKNMNKCQCYHGYWGSDCSEICPGGYINPCHRHGVCNPSDGVCTCDVNWRGDAMCSACSSDWFGELCQYAATKHLIFNTFSIASIKGQGYFTTFLGISFYLPSFGEFYLIRSTSSHFAVQVRQTPCMYRTFYRPLCTTGISIRFNVHLTVTIRSRVTNINTYYPLVWTNGKPIRADHVTYFSASIRMTRITLNRYEITGPNGLLFILTVGQSLSIRLRIPTSLCEHSTGILGPCEQRLSYQNTTDFQVLRNAITNGTVDQSESLFVYKHENFHEIRHVTGTWCNLRMIDSHIVSDTLLLGNHDFITIEIFVKIKSYGGTLLSYGKEEYLSLTNERDIRVGYGSVEFRTGLRLSLNSWSQITLVWIKSSFVLQVYYHDYLTSFGLPLLRTYQFNSQIFASEGRLYIGSWRAGERTTVEVPRGDFNGDIDEIRIWNRRSIPDLIKRHWNINAKASLPGLLHLWKLDQVQGSIAVDVISGKKLYLPLFNKPFWDFSDLPIPRNNLDNKAVFPNSTLQVLAEEFCYSVILAGPLYDNCQSLGTAVAGFYYKVCLQDVASIQTVAVAIEAVIAYADYCEDALDLNFWPARELCDLFFSQYFPYWIGPKCNTSCVFGRPGMQNGSLVCACEHGYWGPACDGLCPGGLWDICSNHGSCDPMNGTCSCDPRWRGDIKNTTSSNVTLSPVSCSVCTSGWRNQNCSIGVETGYSNSSFLSDTAICVAFGDPHVTTFSRASYHLGITGPFQAFKSRSSVMEVLQVPCENSARCRRIREIALTSQSFNISVRMSDAGEVFTNLSSNMVPDTILRYSTSWQTISEGRYRWLDRNRLEITDKDETKLTVLAYFDTLAVAVETSRRQNTSERGICGSSDGDWEQDIIETGNMTSLNGTAILSPLANLTQAKHDDYINNVIRLRDTRMITGYAVAYRTGGGYMLSLGVNYLSLILDFTYPVLSEVSIELWVKLSVYETAVTVGTVLKGKRVLYSIVHQGSSLTVWYNSEIVLTWGSYEINTGLILKHSLWTHLSLTWRNSDGRLVLMLANIDGQREKSIHYGVLVNHFFYIDKGFFFGHDEKNELLNIELALELDELRVWQFARKDEDIVKNMAVKIQGYIDGLIMFCGFDEGYGTTTNGTLYALSDNATTSGYYHRGNKTRDKGIVYEVKPQSVNPLWKPSGAPYPNLGDYEINFESDDLQNEAKTECHKLFYTGNLYKYCGEKLVTQTLFYYEACLMDVAHSGNIQHTKISVSMFAFYCQKVLAVPSCHLHGFYDGFPACEEEPGFDVILIVSICIGVFVFILLIVFCIILLCLRRRRKKESKDKHRHGRGIDLKRVPSPDMYRDVRDDNFGELGISDEPPRYNYGLLEEPHEADGGERMTESSF